MLDSKCMPARQQKRSGPITHPKQHTRPERAIASPPRQTSRRNALAAVVAIFAAYAAVLLYAYGRTPPGLNNDVAEEALRSAYLVQGHHLEVLTFSVGNSAETLYLYLVGGLIQVFGRTILPIQLVGWIFALACIWLVWKLVERVTDAVPAWVPVLAGASSIWLFHYAMAGLRTIAAPVFLGVFALLLDRVERAPDRRIALLCGAVLGLSIYAYTSARLLPIAFVLYAAFRLSRQWRERAALLRRYGAIVAGAFAVSIPNLVFFLQRPGDFLSRGSYIFHGTGGDRVVNMIWTALMPFYYPESYRHSGGLTFEFDAISAALACSGFNPVHLVLAVALLIGLTQVKRQIEQPIVAYLAAVWLTTVLTLGFAGPSLTRMLILLPVYLVLAALGIGFVLQKRAVLWIPVLLVMLFAGLRDSYQYTSGSGQNPQEYSYYFNPAATAIGETAHALGSQGKRVLSVVSRDASVVKYLSGGETAHQRITEFYRRPFNPAQIPLDEFRPDVLLIENTPEFQPLTSRLPPELVLAHNQHYYEVRVQSQ
jgi:hypothetical protein